ncbi:ECF sigma factor [Planctomycetes bacterium Poly30]|uniref:ECF sigma factor n=1 Tax=Saltatorellus ferox TaxID=2528018 RepID=A0A518ETF1_9BACT|nr:ECF sigma factor [Planctomycetes bacterium Poly30]
MTDDTRALDLLTRVQNGDAGAAAELLPILYGELKRIARENMGRERVGHTLQPTALVHEAWMRILGPSSASGGSGNAPAFNGREHFLKTAAQVMRHVLVDHARARNADKRGGGATASGAHSIELDEMLDGYESEGTDLVELDDALQELGRTDPDLAKVVELRTFGGLTMDEVAAAIGVSKATAERRARLARIWLANALGHE